MSIFRFLGKKHKRKEDNAMTTLEQVREAYENLSEDDRKKFHQDISDRVHESIAAQERADGDEDSQSAEDREHESLGAEHADGEGDVAELHETDPEDKPEEEKEKSSIEKRLDRVERMLEKLVEHETEEKAVDMAKEAVETAAEDKAKELYGIGGGVFADTAGTDSPVGTAGEQARSILNKLKR